MPLFRKRDPMYEINKQLHGRKEAKERKKASDAAFDRMVDETFQAAMAPPSPVPQPSTPRPASDPNEGLAASREAVHLAVEFLDAYHSDREDDLARPLMTSGT